MLKKFEKSSQTPLFPAWTRCSVQTGQATFPSSPQKAQFARPKASRHNAKSIYERPKTTQNEGRKRTQKERKAQRQKVADANIRDIPGVVGPGKRPSSSIIKLRALQLCQLRAVPTAAGWSTTAAVGQASPESRLASQTPADACTALASDHRASAGSATDSRD